MRAKNFDETLANSACKKIFIHELITSNEDLEALAEALSKNTTIEELHFSSPKPYFQIEITQIRALTGVLKNHPALKSVHLGDASNYFTDEVFKELLDMITGSAPIIALYCAYSNSVDVMQRAGEALVANTSLEKISLDTLDPSEQEYSKYNLNTLEIFINGILTHKTLSRLRLHGVDLGDTGVSLLSQKLIHQNSLETLEFSSLKFTALSLPVLLPAITSHCPKVKHLSLRGNNLNTGETVLANLLPSLSKLKELVLDSTNLNLNNASSLFAIFKMPTSTVKNLNISNNLYTRNKRNLLFNNLKDMISENRQLEILALNFLGLGDDFVKEFAGLLSDPSKCFLYRLYLIDSNTFSKQTQDALLSIIRINKNIINLSYQGISPVAHKALTINKTNKIKSLQAEFINAVMCLAQLYYANDNILFSSAPVEIIIKIMFLTGQGTYGLSDSNVEECNELILNSFRERREYMNAHPQDLSYQNKILWWSKSSSSGKTLFKDVQELKHENEFKPDCRIM